MSAKVSQFGDSRPDRAISRREMLKWLGLTGSAAALGGLAGCAPVAAPAPAAPAQPTSAPAAAPAAPAAPAAAKGPEAIFDFIAEAAKPYKGTQVNYLAVNTAQTKDVEPYQKEFEELTGIKVTAEYGGENEVLTKIDLELASGGAAYDVMHCHSQTMARYVAGDWMAPLNGFMDDEKLTNKALFMPEDFYASTISQLSTGGKLWAVPLFIATQIMYYRKDIFEQNGITQLPDTFEDFWKVCEAIDGKPVKAFGTRGNRGPTMNVWNWTAWLYGFGGEYFKSYDPSSPDYLVPILDQPEAAEAADFYAQVVQKFCPEGSVNWGWQESSRAFKQKQIAMIQEGSPFGAQFMDPGQSEVADENLIGCFLIPKGKGGRSAPAAAQGWMIPKGSKNKEAAWLWITWATAPARQYRSTIEQPNAMIPRQSVWALDAYKEKYGWGNYIETVNGAFEAAGDWSHYLPDMIPEYTSIGNEVSMYLQQVIGGQKAADAAMKEANDAVYKIVKEAGYVK